MPNDTYNPIPIVKQMHNILHLSGKLQPVSNDFNITFGSQVNQYTLSLIPIPAICGTLGLLAIFILQVSLCARVCCDCCRCLPQFTTEETGKIIPKISKRYRCGIILFIILGILTIVAAQILIIGKVDLTDGVNNSDNTLTYVQDIFNLLNNYGTDLTTYVADLNTDFTYSYDVNNCQAASTLDSYIDEYSGYIDDYTSVVKPVPGQLNGLQDKVQLWGIKYQNYTVWALYLLIMIGVVLYGFGFWRKSQLLMRISIGMTEIVMIALFFLIAAEMFALVRDIYFLY
jgi:hypothetical protein